MRKALAGFVLAALAGCTSVAGPSEPEAPKAKVSKPGLAAPQINAKMMGAPKIGEGP